MADQSREDRRRYTRCSFCGKGQDQVRKLIAGPGVYICDSCVALCNAVLAEDAAVRSRRDPAEPLRTGPTPPPGRGRRRWLRNLFPATSPRA